MRIYTNTISSPDALSEWFPKNYKLRQEIGKEFLSQAEKLIISFAAKQRRRKVRQPQ